MKTLKWFFAVRRVSFVERLIALIAFLWLLFWWIPMNCVTDDWTRLIPIK